MEKLKNVNNEIKCGEVFLTLNGVAIYHCTLCENKFIKIQNYGTHIIDKHIIDFVDEFKTLDSEIDSMYLPEIPEAVKEKYSNFESSFDEIEIDSDASDTEENVLINDDDSYDKLCGEAHLTNKGILIFSCTLCECRYKGVQEFDQHVFDLHYSSPETIEGVSFEILWPEDMEDEKLPSKWNNKTDPINENNNVHLVTDEKEIKKGPKKRIPKWKETFDSIYCAETNKVHYKCKLCSTVIKDRSNVEHHIKRVHENIKRFECSECHRFFHGRSEHKIHMRIHTGEKPYLCVECGMSFISASELHKHKGRYHLPRAKDKACKICGKTFMTQKHLFKHKTVHSEERPFECEVCNAKFKVKSSLILHSRIHEDKRMFKCDLCSSSYNYKSVLKSHMQSKHDITLE